MGIYLDPAEAEAEEGKKEGSISTFTKLNTELMFVIPCEMKVSCTVLHERKKRRILFSTGAMISLKTRIFLYPLHYQHIRAS